MKKQSIIVSFLFLICIYFFFISSFIVEDKSFSYNENRKLEQKPVLTLDTLLSGEFTEKYEKYVTDQVLFRDDFVKFSTNIKLLMGQKEVNGIYISDGFLVEKFKESDIDLDLLNKNKNDVKKFVEKYNAKFALIPTTGGVIDGLYPKYSNNINQTEFISELYSFVGESNCIDIFSGLKSHQNEEIYYRTDHHWTTLGAYYGYLGLSKDLGLNSVDLDKFNLSLVDAEFYGTIQSKVNYKVNPDKIYKYTPKFDVSYSMILNEDTKTKVESLYDETKLTTKEKYAVFLGGNNAINRIKIVNGVEDKGKLLIIKDSFSHCLTPFIVNHYSEVVLVDLRYYMGGMSSILQNEDFDDILVLYNLSNFVSDRNLIRLNK